MNKLEKMFHEQHPNYNKEKELVKYNALLVQIAKDREEYEKNNNWLTIDEINDIIKNARSEYNNKYELKI